MATADVDDGVSLLQQFDEARQQVAGDELTAQDMDAAITLVELSNAAHAEAANKSTLPSKYPKQRKDEEQKQSEENQRDRLKRGYGEKDSDEKKTKRKKQKKDDEDKKNKGKKQKKNPVNEKPGKTISARVGSKPAPQIPPEWRDKINGKGGQDLKLVIMRQMFKTDVSKHHGRLLIPWKQIRDDEFLSHDEKRMLQMPQQKILVKLMEPCDYESNLMLTQWNMQTSNNYALTSNWKDVLERNLSVWDDQNKKWIDRGFKENDIYQLWSFRVNGELRFALIMVNPNNGSTSNGDGASKSHGSSSEGGCNYKSWHRSAPRTRRLIS